MKFLKLVFAFVIVCNFVSAQSDNQIETFIEVMPEFPGGETARSKFIGDNLLFPESARNNNIEGRVVAQFIVRNTGIIDSIKILRGIGGGCDEEVIRIIKLMPEWKPAFQNGKAVSVKFILPVNFVLEDSGKKHKKKKN